MGIWNATGGTITTFGSYKIHTFLLADSGTSFTPSVQGTGTVAVLIVAGGGGGGHGLDLSHYYFIFTRY